jgi:hypothetical protein
LTPITSLRDRDRSPRIARSLQVHVSGLPPLSTHEAAFSLHELSHVVHSSAGRGRLKRYPWTIPTSRIFNVAVGALLAGSILPFIW